MAFGVLNGGWVRYAGKKLSKTISGLGAETSSMD